MSSRSSERDVSASRESTTSDGGVWVRADRPRSSTGGLQGHVAEDHDQPGHQTGKKRTVILIQ